MSYDSGSDDSEGSLRDFIASEDSEEEPDALYIPLTDDEPDDNGAADDAEIIGQTLEVEGTKVGDDGRWRSTRSRRAPQRYVESKEYLEDLAEACSKSRTYVNLSDDENSSEDDADIDDEDDSDFEMAIDEENATESDSDDE